MYSAKKLTKLKRNPILNDNSNMFVFLIECHKRTIETTKRAKKSTIHPSTRINKTQIYLWRKSLQYKKKDEKKAHNKIFIQISKYALAHNKNLLRIFCAKYFL